MSGDSEGKATMTFHEIINLHPHPSDVDRNLLLRCIEECLDCAASCTACADACLGESELAELRGCVRLNLDCADACEATGRIVTRQTSPDLRLIKATVEACAVACLACAEECDRPSDLARPLARRDHDVLGPDIALGGRHGPAAALADDIRHPRVAEGGGAVVDGAPRERGCQARRVPAPVGAEGSGGAGIAGPCERGPPQRPPR